MHAIAVLESASRVSGIRLCCHTADPGSSEGNAGCMSWAAHAGGEKGEGEGSIKELVGVAHVSPPQSAFASAQPPRSVFADAQMPVSDSEAEPDSARSHRRSFDQPKANQVCGFLLRKTLALA